MAFTWPSLLTILNCSALFFSLALVGISPASLYLTGHGMHWMNKAWPQGYYEWYRGPSWDPYTKHKIRLMYESKNEYMILTAGAVGLIAGLVGIVGFFFTRQTSKPSTQKATLFFQILPATLTFIVTFITFVFIFTQDIFDADNSSTCAWRQGYNPNNVFHCTHEQAACNIVGYFTVSKEWGNQARYDTKRHICGETQTGRHLVVPLFVVSTLFLGFAVGKFFVEKKKSRFVESADERLARLQREEE